MTKRRTNQWPICNIRWQRKDKARIYSNSKTKRKKNEEGTLTHVLWVVVTPRFMLIRSLAYRTRFLLFLLFLASLGKKVFTNFFNSVGLALRILSTGSSDRCLMRITSMLFDHRSRVQSSYWENLTLGNSWTLGSHLNVNTGTFSNIKPCVFSPTFQNECTSLQTSV